MSASWLQNCSRGFIQAFVALFIVKVGVDALPLPRQKGTATLHSRYPTIRTSGTSLANSIQVNFNSLYRSWSFSLLATRSSSTPNCSTTSTSPSSICMAARNKRNAKKYLGNELSSESAIDLKKPWTAGTMYIAILCFHSLQDRSELSLLSFFSW